MARARRPFRFLLALAAALSASAWALGPQPSLNFGPPYVVTGGFLRPFGLAPDQAHGRLPVADPGNKRVLKANGPAATAWTVFKSDPSWSNPYGLDVDASNNVFVADTGNHRIVKIAGATTTAFGHFGTGGGEFRFPRDVAIDQH